jgi:hypothetical protein
MMEVTVLVTILVEDYCMNVTKEGQVMSCK